jgi:hypothetical protein
MGVSMGRSPILPSGLFLQTTFLDHRFGIEELLDRGQAKGGISNGKIELFEPFLVSNRAAKASLLHKWLLRSSLIFLDSMQDRNRMVKERGTYCLMELDLVNC